jgi:hypothetical protein
MNRESAQLITCNFNLVLKEEVPPQPAIQLGSQLSRSAARRPGIVTTIIEEGLAGVVTNKRFASGHAIGIRDHWRC